MKHPIFACSMAVFCVNKVGRHGGNPHAFSPKKNKTQRCKLPKYDKAHHVAMRKVYDDNGTTHLVEDAPNKARFLLGFAFSDLRFSPCTSNHVTMRKVYDDKGDNLCNRTSYIKLSQTE